MSSPAPTDRPDTWRLFIESALALIDVLGSELERDAGIPMRWFDVLIHLDEAQRGIPMSELAARIFYSKSGLTRVVDRMEATGLVRRVRPEHDRRTILVTLTGAGKETLERARHHHGQGVDKHFSRHLTKSDADALALALEKVSTHVRAVRAGRI